MQKTIKAKSFVRSAILVMCAGVLLLIVNDTIAKWLVDRYSPPQIIFVRSLIALPLVAALICGLHGVRSLKSHRISVHALRGMLIVGATMFYFLSLRSLPLAEATSLIFSAPLFVTVLSVLVFGERVGVKRAAVVLAGFVGVLVVVRPGGETFQLASLLAIAAAFLSALIMLSARWVASGDSIWTMMLYTPAFLAVFTCFSVLTQWPELQPFDLVLFVCMAICGTLGLNLMSEAFRMAPASIVAPFDYTALVWATALGWLVWGTIPEIWVYAGAAIIIASCVYLVLTEARIRTSADPQ